MISYLPKQLPYPELVRKYPEVSLFKVETRPGDDWHPGSRWLYDENDNLLELIHYFDSTSD
jgi:hypothetical protein